MRISTPQTPSLPSFIKVHIGWQGMADTPEWKYFTGAWAAQEYRVAATALDVVCSHYREQLTGTERNLLSSVSDSLFSALDSASAAA